MRNAACPPGTVSGSDSSSISFFVPSTNVAFANSAPVSALAVSAAMTVFGAMPPKAIAKWSITNLPSLTTRRSFIPAVTMLISSSRRRACLNGLTYSNASARTGTSTHSTISFGLMSTTRYLRKNSCTGTDLLATVMLSSSKLESIIFPPMEASIGFISEMGLAVTKFPPKHATFLICVDANHRSMSRIGMTVRVNLVSSLPSDSHLCWIVLSGVQAPIVNFDSDFSNAYKFWILSLG